jgi:hypothetical protein
MPQRYSQNLMCRLGATVVLRSACTPAAVTLEPRRSRDVSAGRLLTARSPSSVNATSSARYSLLSSGDTTAGNRRTIMPMASSVVFVSAPAASPAHHTRPSTQRTPAALWRRLERTSSRPSATQPPPAPSPTAPPAYPPTHTPSPAAAVLACSASRPGWRGSSPCVSSSPSVRAGGGPSTAPASLCGGCASPPRVGGKTPADEVGQRHHHAPLSTLLLSAVHPVTLYTQPAKHHATASSEQCTSHSTSTCLCLSPQRCHVNDARYIRRCWYNSDAVHTCGTWTGTLRAGGRLRFRLLLAPRGGHALTSGHA